MRIRPGRKSGASMTSARASLEVPCVLAELGKALGELDSNGSALLFDQVVKQAARLERQELLIVELRTERDEAAEVLREVQAKSLRLLMDCGALIAELRALLVEAAGWLDSAPGYSQVKALHSRIAIVLERTRS